MLSVFAGAGRSVACAGSLGAAGASASTPARRGGIGANDNMIAGSPAGIQALNMCNTSSPRSPSCRTDSLACSGYEQTRLSGDVHICVYLWCTIQCSVTADRAAAHLRI